MGIGDKAKHEAEDLAGKVKETAGKLTDDEKTEAEGKTDQAKAKLKKAGDDVRDAFDR
ncbi:MAG TPA: CsbD family protein [Jiangellaceae bacterium]